MFIFWIFFTISRREIRWEFFLVSIESWIFFKSDLMTHSCIWSYGMLVRTQFKNKAWSIVFEYSSIQALNNNLTIFWSFKSVFWQFLCEKNGRKWRNPRDGLFRFVHGNCLIFGTKVDLDNTYKHWQFRNCLE